MDDKQYKIIVELLQQILDQLKQDKPRLLKSSRIVRAKRFNR